MRLNLFNLSIILCLQNAAAFVPINARSRLYPEMSSVERNNGLRRTSVPVVNMVAGGAERAYQDEYYDGVRIGPPPDLPSLLLHNRIIYIGTTTANGQPVGFETEAFAIADVMKYVRPPVHTVALGQAFGAAAMLLAQGKRGQRYALPNATILLNQPKSQARGQASDIAIKAKEVQKNRRKLCELIASASGKPLATVIEDCSRVKYLQPDEAVEYGLIDKVITTEALAVKPSFMSALSK
ncbi:hypothetical protein ACA910_014119 [Epithemia clementina (nom. ined.)]